MKDKDENKLMNQYFHQNKIKKGQI